MNDLRALLREVYDLDGPRSQSCDVVPPEEFAALDEHGVNRWDFDRRDLMHRIAKAISASDGVLIVQSIIALLPDDKTKGLQILDAARRMVVRFKR
jgi:hypothetical protein